MRADSIRRERKWSGYEKEVGEGQAKEQSKEVRTCCAAMGHCMLWDDAYGMWRDGDRGRWKRQ